MYKSIPVNTGSLSAQHVSDGADDDNNDVSFEAALDIG